MSKRSPIPVVAVHDDDLPTPTLRNRLNNLGPWGGSALLHSVILILLLLWRIPFLQSGSLQLTAFTGVAEGEVEEFAFALEDTTAADLENDEIEITPPTELLSSEITDATIEVVEPELEFPDIETMGEPTQPLSDATTTAATMSGQAIGEADSVESAVDQITGGIRGRLEQGDVLVVWLLDSSLSLQADRQRIAKRLQGFLEDPRDGTTNKNRLVNAVVTFGRGFKEAVSPTESSKPILNSIKNAAIDKSGQEKVFLAVEKCVAKYRKRWKSQLMIVIWTDESGDDTARLSKTIARAKQADVAVSVVGRSAVLGDQLALQDWIDPKTRMYHQLPIQNGPDSAMPERIRLGYWFRGPPPANVRQRGRRFPVWYGNDDLIGLTSSFSPWALTRLAIATGGSFTLFDSDEERAPYDVQRMNAYRPSYGSLQDYKHQLKSHPLRKAVHLAVGMTYREEIQAPNLMFFGIKSPQPPHAIQPLYFTPRAFQSKLASERGRIGRQIKHANYAIEKALAKVSDTDELEKGLEYEYDNESSPRWKAWYDLTRGRLLAVSVRWEEYRLAIADIMQRDSLRDTTNGLILGPSTHMRSDGKYVSRADEAKRLLTRCLRNNADTPWAYLAERELAQGLGINVRQMSYSATGTLSKQSGSRAPKF